jgi:hypothetical protein
MFTLNPFFSDSRFSFVGDFEEIYGATEDRPEHESQVGKWDAVLTCFFIDTVSLKHQLFDSSI